jgi:hypothetical protein
MTEQDAPWFAVMTNPRAEAKAAEVQIVIEDGTLQ